MGPLQTAGIPELHIISSYIYSFPPHRSPPKPFSYWSLRRRPVTAQWLVAFEDQGSRQNSQRKTQELLPKPMDLSTGPTELTEQGTLRFGQGKACQTPKPTGPNSHFLEAKPTALPLVLLKGMALGSFCLLRFSVIFRSVSVCLFDQSQQKS